MNYSVLIYFGLSYKGLRPQIILYKITIIAITNKTWIKPLVPSPGITPRNPNNHAIIKITATSHKILFIIV